MDITLDARVEELVEAYPQAAGFLADRGVVCIRRGEPYWGTLGELMALKGIENPGVVVEQLRDFLADQAMKR
jgi:hypothetical protein